MVRLSCLLLCLGCTQGEPTDTDTETDPLPTEPAGWITRFEVRGPYAVGSSEGSVTYPDPATDGDRTNRLVVWYPTEATEGALAAYLGPRSAKDVLLDAPVAPGTFPLVLFSHGYQGDVDNGTNLMAWFASHGWVVAAIEHTGNTLADGDNVGTEIYLRRGPDLSATLDHLLGPHPLAASVDPARVLATGHSFGNYTLLSLAGAPWDVDGWQQRCDEGSTHRICADWTPAAAATLRSSARDPRILAFASLAGSGTEAFTAAGLGTIASPWLQLSGALDSSVPNETVSDPLWAALPAGDKVRVDLAHGDHQASMDFAGVAPGLIPGTSADAIPWERGHRLSYVYLGAFAQRYVLGGGEGLDGVLDGSVLVDEDVTVSVK